MALQDLTNLSSEGGYPLAPSSPLSVGESEPCALGKGAWDGLSSPLKHSMHGGQQQMMLPAMSISGSSSPLQGRSSSPFQFGAYDAPTSPSFSLHSGKFQLEDDDLDLLDLNEPASLSRASPIPLRAARSPARAPTPNHLPPLDASSPSSLPAAADPASGPLRLSLALDTALHFGRKAKKPARLATRRGEKTLPVLLPRSAKNASRVHCVVRVVGPVEGERRRVVVRVEVVGQNGLKVDGRLVKCGEVVELERKLGRDLELEFWGWAALVKVGGTRAERGEPPRREKRKAPAAVNDDDEYHTRPQAPSSTSARSSTPASAASFLARRARAHTPALHRASTPALPAGATKWDRQFAKRQQQEDDEAEDFVKPAPLPTLRLPASSTAHSAASSPMPQGPASPALSALSLLSSPVRATSSSRALEDPATRVAAALSLDLAGMLASAIVFHPRSTVPVSEVIKEMLQTTGGMWDVLPAGKGSGSGSAQQEELAVAAWWDVVEGVLRQEAFFGCIENAGLRDASDEPLLPEFFYVPEKDANRDRVEALEPFVKRVRASRTAGGGTRYYWRRPTTKKNK